MYISRGNKNYFLKIFSKNYIYLLKSVLLETGYTHQIRSQFAKIGIPIIGDRLYETLYSYSFTELKNWNPSVNLRDVDRIGLQANRLVVNDSSNTFDLEIQNPSWRIFGNP